jgi:predicted Zn-dependent protease
MSSQLSKLTDLVTQARRAGVQAAEVLYESAQGTTIKVERGHAIDRSVERDQLTIHCWLSGGRMGTAQGSLAEATTVLEKAQHHAEQADPDPTSGPTERMRVLTSGLSTLDRRWDSVRHAERIEVISAAERGARTADRRVRANEFTYQDERTYRAFTSSRGIELEENGTRYQMKGVAFVGEGDQLVRLEETIGARTFASAACLPFGQNLARRAIGLTRLVTPPSGPYRVVFPSLATARLFRRLATHFTPEKMRPETCFLARSKTDQPLFHRLLHLLDDGVRPGALRTRAFDDRGVHPVPLTLIRDGHIDRLFLDSSAARAQGTRPTGHMHEGALRPSNLLIRPGTRSANAILAESGCQTLMVDVLPPDFELDMQTGDLFAKVSGRLLTGSKPQGAVRNVSLRGNLIEVLSQIVDLTSNTDRHQHVDAPGLILDGFVLGD